MSARSLTVLPERVCGLKMSIALPAVVHVRRILRVCSCVIAANMSLCSREGRGEKLRTLNLQVWCTGAVASLNVRVSLRPNFAQPICIASQSDVVSVCTSRGLF